jgi:hypothetical protein
MVKVLGFAETGSRGAALIVWSEGFWATGTDPTARIVGE